MNKLEEYKKAKALEAAALPEEGPDELDYTARKAFTEGFDAAIALDLPVKFLKWYRNVFMTELMTDEQEQIFLKIGMLKPSTDDLYKFWIENIYKPEL